MGEYIHLDLEERKKIYRLRQAGKGIKAIAARIGRSPSSVSRELRRNSDTIGYLPDTAYLKYRKRRTGRMKKLTQCEMLKNYIVTKLQNRWSPEQIAGRMRVEQQPFYASHETIYQFVYSNEGKALSLYHFLRYRQLKRGQLYGRKHHSEVIRERVSIHERPAHIQERRVVGHFEGDLTFFKGDRKNNLVVLTERASRFVMITKSESKQTDPVTDCIYSRLKDLPDHVRFSVTFDNGSEFAKHTVLKEKLGMKTYFCDPGAPWQKGTVENSISRLHGHIPKNSCLKWWSDQEIVAVESEINRTPRKCLGFLTPFEVFYREFRGVALQT